MSAYTEALYYYPGSPPLVTLGEVADFIEALDRLDLLDTRVCQCARVKFGSALDQDDESIYPETSLSDTISTFGEITWDAHLENASLRRVVGWLRSPRTFLGLFGRSWQNRALYRAMFTFGMLKEEVFSAFSREVPPGGEGQNLWLTDLSLWCTPVELNDPQEPVIFHVGYMALSVSGYGALWPWTYEDTLRRLQASEPLRRLCEVCRTIWPIPSHAPTPEIIANRRKLGHLWGDDVEVPSDWRWAINETY